jgi:hypothetical protein
MESGGLFLWVMLTTCSGHRDAKADSSVDTTLAIRHSFTNETGTSTHWNWSKPIG